MTPVSAYTPDSGDPTFDVESYDLDLTYRVRTNRLDGRAVLNAVAALPTRQVRLDLVGLRAGAVRVDGDPVSFRQDARSLRLTLPVPLEPGERFSIDVAYAGAPRPRRTRWGTLGWEELHDGALVAAQPIGAPTWFPCNDRPDDRATYRITLATDAPYQPLATGVAVDSRRRGRLEQRTFELRVPTATYLVAAHVGRFATTEVAVPGVIAELVHPPELAEPAARAFAMLPRMIAVFEDVFGPYPQERCTMVVTADPLEIPLEAQGMALFGVNHLDPVYERLIAHELAHQWVGNSVGLRDWRDIWLNEGFACYAEWLWSERSGGPTAHSLAALHRERVRAEPADLILSDPGAAAMFDDRVYKRGALTLHALRLAAGDEAFFAFLRRWTTTHRHQLVGTADFRLAVAESFGTAGEELLHRWIDAAALPPLR
ncbi:M1 family metallopeptidase [Microbacterium invictum]|uniref:Aminopeptidase N n=1 Tax=Microbacterium invictum TaxID=515415 RepID=A0ABZ0VD09_9MICO|nr:M1 family metallopeptidase [Microbacterium invictum]WQB71518.1 M1 family metallopeptidase [Microbacterium invictum]